MAESRGTGAHLPVAHDKIGLPPRAFLYTLDQLSVMLDLPESRIKQAYIYFEGRSIGSRDKDLMTARNIAPAGDKPDWRVTEREFIRWMRTKGYRWYDRSTFTN